MPQHVQHHVHQRDALGEGGDRGQRRHHPAQRPGGGRVARARVEQRGATVAQHHLQHVPTLFRHTRGDVLEEAHRLVARDVADDGQHNVAP